MSFLKRVIRDGIRQGVENAVSSAVKQAVEPKATQWANRTAQQLDQMAQTQTQEVRQSFSGLEGAFSNLQRAAENYATEVSKNVKVCPGCGEAVSAEKAFCPGCGTKLPELSVAAGALCPQCGKQNTVGTKYCDSCGTKLPAAIAEEASIREKMEEELAQWDEILPQYPKWNCGGTEICIEAHDPQQYGGCFATVNIGFPRNTDARANLDRYWQLLTADGFRTAGKYPDSCYYYKKVGNDCYMVSREHSFDGGTDNIYLEFALREPEGGFDYVKPEPKQQPTLDDLADGLKDLKKLFRR